MSDNPPACRLVSGLFAIGIQGLLAFLCVTTLVVKRMQEAPQRPWLIWFLDASKQGVSSSLSHGSNILVSIIIASSIKGKESDECQWYCLAYTSDTVVGTIFNMLLLKGFERVMQSHFPSYAEYLKFGVYGDPPSVARWWPQMLVWALIVITSKSMVLSVLMIFLIPLDAAGKALFTPIRKYPKLELLLVMIVIPMILNSIQFWVTDTFLKLNSDEEGQQSTLLPTESSHNSFDEELLGTRMHGGLYSLSDDSEDGVLPGNETGIALTRHPTNRNMYQNVRPLTAAKNIANGHISWYNNMFDHLKKKRPQFDRTADEFEDLDES